MSNSEIGPIIILIASRDHRGICRLGHAFLHTCHQIFLTNNAASCISRKARDSVPHRFCSLLAVAIQHKKTDFNLLGTSWSNNQQSMAVILNHLEYHQWYLKWCLMVLAGPDTQQWDQEHSTTVRRRFSLVGQAPKHDFSVLEKPSHVIWASYWCLFIWTLNSEVIGDDVWWNFK